ncbi:MAG: dihydroorotate dehydrogenase electron transfer subunit [Candidatus Coatesbacteria bacterium]
MTPPPSRIVKIVSNEPLTDPEFRELQIDAGAAAADAKPGQFVHVRLPGTLDPLLRRPFSVAGAGDGRLTIVYKRVGALTSRLASLRPGAELDMFGPRGHGYRLEGPKAAHAILAGGGYGAAPLLFLARTLRERALASRITLLVGARTAAQLLWRERVEAESSWLDAGFATDDGSYGEKGTVLDLLMARLSDPAAGVRVCACGPSAMLAGLARIRPGLPAEVAAEGHMGCGMGVCQGCVLPMVPAAGGPARYARVCHEGPVFDVHAIDWAAVKAARL